MRKHLLQGFLAAATVAFGFSTASAVDITGAGARSRSRSTRMGRGVQGEDGHRHELPVDRVRRRHRADQGEDGRLRRSDMPLKPDDLQAAGLMQFPAIIGGIVPVVNVEGIAPGALRLTGPLLADIYLGKIKNWNDKAIADLNPGLKLQRSPSPSCAARTARAPPSISPTTCRR